MASIIIKFQPSITADKKGSIYYQIIHERKVRKLHTGFHIFPTEWDERRKTVKSAQNDSARSILIQTIGERLRQDVDRLNRICRKFDNTGVFYTADDIISQFSRYVQEYTLFNFMEGLISQLRKNGRIRTSETYKTTLNSFRKFLSDRSAKQPNPLQGNDIILDCLTSEIMESYECWLHNRGVIPNTVSFYTRILRAVYNRAVEQEIIENRNPFKHVYTGIDKTIKRALPLPVIRKIKILDLSAYPALDFARDMFMLSFYMRGMSFIDMAFLKKSDLRNGYISYRRHKTGRLLTIKWTGEMQSILDKYPENKSVYLLPIIKNTGINERYTYLNAGYKINRNLKKIAELTDIKIPLTLYVARHSWASAAKNKGIALSVISEGMGHDSEMTTQIYLTSLDTSAVDKANSIILRCL
ncbi:MAG: site-specific integrase [Muribaculaceae bacterium]|nr:site-specific integrase [Muribaculaceae bacterium]